MPGSVLLELIFHALALLTPIVLPAAAFAFGARLGFWWRTIGVLLASLVSLPLGFLLMLLAHDPALLTYDHINPGVGVAAIPVMIEWAVIFTAMVVVALCLAVRKVFFSPKS